MSVKGIDISRYQGKIDFAKVKKNVDFVIIQAGYGRYAAQTDARFEENYSGCRKNGIPCGAYWFSYAKTAAEAKLEAKACLEAIKGKEFEYPIYFDIEGSSLTNKADVSAMCSAFCDELEKAGYFAGIYMSRSPAQSLLDGTVAKKYSLWLAEYGAKLNYSGAYGMWQYSSSGKVSGINADVDLDICYEDFPKIIKSRGLNGLKKEDKKVLDENGFKKGDKGDGVLALKCLIRLAADKKIVKAELDDTGGFGGGTQSAVNALLKNWGYAQNGIAGDKFIRKLYKSLK